MHRGQPMRAMACLAKSLADSHPSMLMRHPDAGAIPDKRNIFETHDQH